MGASALSGYVLAKDINDKNVGKIVSIVGVIVDYQPPKASRGTDWMCTFKICDRSCSLVDTGILVRIFKPHHQLPTQTIQLGHMASFQQFKVMSFDGAAVLTSKYDSSWTIFSVTNITIPGKGPKVNVPVERKVVPYIKSTKRQIPDEELQYCKDLSHYWNDRGGTSAAYGVNQEEYNDKILPAKEKRRKFSLIHDMTVNNFYDVAAYVLKVYYESDARVTLYITDYTSHQDLFEYNAVVGHDPEDMEDLARGGGGVTRKKRQTKPEKEKISIPKGKYTLQCTLWDRQARYARANVQAGSFVLLSNLRAKKNSDGKLEGSVSDDQRYPEKEHILVLQGNDENLKELLRRRRKFMSDAFAEERKFFELQQKKQKEETDNVVKETIKIREHVNPNVKCGYDSTPNTEIGDITSRSIFPDPMDEFSNKTYRICGRVIDYMPELLEDFCMLDDATLALPRRHTRNPNSPPPDSDEESNNEEEDEDVAMSDVPQKWIWHFVLKIEGNDGAAINVHVRGADAKVLLSMDAADLRNNETALLRLREKMFILWGNLEERVARYQQVITATDEKIDKLMNRLDDVNTEPELDVLESELRLLHQKRQQAEEAFETPDSAGNMQFECLINEAGIDEDDGIVRKFWMNGTRILA